MTPCGGSYVTADQSGETASKYHGLISADVIRGAPNNAGVEGLSHVLNPDQHHLIVAYRLRSELFAVNIGNFCI
jgi:hypothetical protein